MTKRTKFIIGFWFVFILLFIIGHKLLSVIILQHQERPAAETKEAYELITQYQPLVIDFYNQYGRCPTMDDIHHIIPQVKAYHYVKTIRLLADQTTSTCFISAVMRDDTPSADVKSKLIVVAHTMQKEPLKQWPCYTNITNAHTIEACRDNPLPVNFKEVLLKYQKVVKMTNNKIGDGKTPKVE